MASETTSLATRLLRLGGLIRHLLGGLATLVFRFPRWDEHERRAAMSRWAHRVLRTVAVDLRCHGEPQHCLVVMNHVSWLDILLLAAVHPSTFIAKEEISRWPVVGTLVTRAGTMYIERGSFRALRQVNHRLSSALRSGVTIACFPEGTTSYGERVERFHAGLFQPAIDAEVHVQPVALRYTDMRGKRTEASAYVGDDSFWASIWRVLSTPRMNANLHFLAPIEAVGWQRRAIAERTRDDIERALNGEAAQPLARRHGT